jgi:N-acetylneuraminic acid mutarotase
VYGTLGQAATGNIPGTRTGAAGWTNASGALFLFGGDGYDSADTQGFLNDLWSYAPAAPSFPAGFALSAVPDALTVAVPEAGGSATSTLSTEVTGGFNSSINLTATGQPSGITVSFSPASISGGGTSAMTMTIASGVPIGTYALTIIGTGGNLTASTPLTLTITGTPPPTISPVAGNYSTAQTITLSDSNPAATIYYTTDESTPTTSSPVYTGPITVSTAENLQAIAVASGYANSAIASAYYTIGTPTGLGEWTWMGGYFSVDGAGSYGTLGTPWGGNIPPARSGAAGWPEKNGNLWMFGGTNELSKMQEFNDLWYFNIATNVWTWMGGSNTGYNCGSIYGACGAPGVYGTLGTPAATNLPGARTGASTWVDGAGNLWLFGGYGYDVNDHEVTLNDLWEFDTSTKQWTWRSGTGNYALMLAEPGVYGTLGVAAAGNTPGSRSGANGWVDSSGNLWLFGGQGTDAYNPNLELNDLWKFNPSTNLWAWMGGSNIVPVLQAYESGVYGTLGVASAANIPASRYGAGSWTDSSGNFWLFGGNGLGGLEAKYNDLWKFNPSTNQWTWVSGASTFPCTNYGASTQMYGGNFCGQLSVYGTLGVSSASTMPGGRSPGASWVDSSGNFWLFGGTGLDVGGEFIGPTNDLWSFNPSTSLWTWMGGLPLTSGCINAGFQAVACGGDIGIYGNTATPIVGGIPGSRTNAIGWTDTGGNLWLFSGWGQASFFLPNVETNAMNDVWKYQPSPSTLPPAVAPAFSVAAGTYTPGGFVAIFNAMTNATIHYTVDGSTPTITSPTYAGLLPLASTETINAIATAPGYLNSVVASAAYVIQNYTATPTFSIAGGTYTSAQTVAISDTTAGATIYYTTDGTSPTTSSPVYSAPIIISSSETLQAIATASGDSASNIATAVYAITLPAASSPTFNPAAGTYPSTQTVTISDATAGATIYYTTNGAVPTTSSAVYSVPIIVSSSETVQAMAIAAGTSSSTIGSAAYTISLAAPNFSVTSSLPALTVAAGQSASTIVSITSLNGFASTVSFSCTGLPAGASCSFSPSTVTPSGATATTTLTVTTSSTTANLRRGFGNQLPGATLVIAFCICTWKRRKRLQVHLQVAALLVGLSLINGCGSGAASSSSTQPPPVTATVTVTATAGSLQHSTTVSLTVN